MADQVSTAAIPAHGRGTMKFHRAILAWACLALRHEEESQGKEMAIGILLFLAKAGDFYGLRAFAYDYWKKLQSKSELVRVDGEKGRVRLAWENWEDKTRGAWIEWTILDPPESLPNFGPTSHSTEFLERDVEVEWTSGQIVSELPEMMRLALACITDVRPR